MPFKKLGRSDPDIEAGFIFPVAHDQVRFAFLVAFENVHADEPFHSINGAGPGAEKAFKAFLVVRLAVDIVDGDKSGGGFFFRAQARIVTGEGAHLS